MENKLKTCGQYVNKYFLDYSFFEKKEKEFFYLIGLMASDGSVKNKKTFSLSQSGDSGYELLSLILKKLKSNHKIYTYKNSNSFTITDERVVKVLTEYNIYPNKTLTYELPHLNDVELKYFLQGYVDGDGSIGIYDNGNNHKYLVISVVGTENFIKSVNDRLIIKGNIRHIKRCVNLYELRFYGKKALDFGYYLYGDVCFPNYKINIFKEFIKDDVNGIKYKKYYNVKTTIIEKLKSGDPPIKLSKEYNIPYKTIYTWKLRNLI
jgi:hypothetical protein